MDEPSIKDPPKINISRNHRSLMHHLAFGAFSLIVLIGACTVVYLWQHNKNDALQTKLNTLQSKVSATSRNDKPTTSTGTTGAQTVHFVESLARPYDGIADNYDFITKLGVPGFLQAVRTPSNNNFQGTEEAFTNEYNNELGRWTLGEPDYDNEDGGSNQVSLLAIANDWLESTGQTDYSLSYGNPLETPTQKAQYISQLKSSTTTCSTQPSKGFTTIDGTLNVCYKFNNVCEQAYGAYDPIVELNGYGDIKG